MNLPDERRQQKPEEDPIQGIQFEIEETKRGLKEITLKLEQSKVEVDKLTQRNTSFTAHLQQVMNKLGQMPPEEFKLAYDSALDAQQRLFVMRGQLDKLQSDQSNLEHHLKVLEKVRDGFITRDERTGEKNKNALASVEMIINAQEAERQRLSRQMHDGPAQALSNFILQSEIAMRLMDLDIEQARAELTNLKNSAMNTFQKVRSFIFELRPMMLDDLGLIPTIRRYAESFKEQSGIETNITIVGTEQRMEPYLEIMIFRALQEILGNSARYSQANNIKIKVDSGDSTIHLSVEDNGRGFDPDIIQKENSLGLKLIKERVELLGGTFEIDSAPGKGAMVRLNVPARIKT